jgi:2-desacetyl-2-hydroxyethyl bacteriochlorophyllide A dehydrogenase
MKAAVFAGPERFDVTEISDPECGPHDVVVQVALCGICGSDLHSYLEGAFVEPGQVMGHEFSGTVVQAGAEVSGVSVGDRVTAVPILACGRCPRCLDGSTHLCETALAASIAYGLPGAFAEYVRIPDVVVGGNLHRIPDGVGDVAAAMVEPLSVALHAVRSSQVGPADVVVVLGLGSIGLNVVQMARALGAGRIVGVDISPARLELASRLGADDIIDARARNALEAVVELTGAGAYGVGARADVVIEASGVPALLADAISMARAGGRVRIAALYSEAVQIDANQIVQKELDMSGTFAYRGEFPQVLSLLESGRVQADVLVTDTFPLSGINDAFRAQLDKAKSIKVQVAVR